ncbi:MAG: nuclear transport factor 2 family protein [Emticicia sp.]|uniref:nuclear transport factor 2 family protein n=1 Tax=Emticicia sp. TaxID=1930953 RepID=UPI003BA497F4
MKKLILTLSLLGFSSILFAQKSFTMATFNGILAEYGKDSKAFFSNRLSNDFRYISAEGTFSNRDEIVARDSQKYLKTEVLEPVIFQSGDLAVISGIHAYYDSTDGTKITGKVACTYTFQLRANKWMFIASHHTAIKNDK